MGNKNNSGNYNSGDCNSGNYNSGYYNSGYCNSGNYNSGDHNSGDRNSGDCNSGNYNSGDRNSGYRNSGDCNSGNYNSGNYNSGFFNTNRPTVRLFNKDTGKERDQISLPYIGLSITKWIPESDMTNEQKANDPDFHTNLGTLIKLSYHQAWAQAWEKADDKLKQSFLDLPNFDSSIFKEITGIDVDHQSEPCDNRIVEIDGKKYKLTAID